MRLVARLRLAVWTVWRVLPFAFLPSLSLFSLGLSVVTPRTPRFSQQISCGDGRTEVEGSALVEREAMAASHFFQGKDVHCDCTVVSLAIDLYGPTPHPLAKWHCEGVVGPLR